MKIKDLDFQEQLSHKEPKNVDGGFSELSGTDQPAVKSTNSKIEIPDPDCAPPCWPPKPRR